MSGENQTNKITNLPQIVVEIKNHDSQLFNSCYDIIKGWITQDQVITTENILEFTVRVIKLVQKMSKDKGAYKKTLVLDLIKRLVAEVNYPNPELKKLVLEFIDTTLPGFIDVTISVAIGQINLGKRCSKLRKLCCCCC